MIFCALVFAADMSAALDDDEPKSLRKKDWVGYEQLLVLDGRNKGRVVGVVGRR